MYAECPEWWEPFECCRALPVSTPPMSANYRNLDIDDHSAVRAVWHRGALGLVRLALMCFSVVAECGALGYDCHDLHMGHVCCIVITSLSSIAPRYVDQYGAAHFVTGCTFDQSSAYLVYRRFAGINWSSFGPTDCWFACTFNNGRVSQLSAAEIKLHLRTASGEHASIQMLVTRVSTRIIKSGPVRHR